MQVFDATNMVSVIQKLLHFIEIFYITFVGWFLLAIISISVNLAWTLMVTLDKLVTSWYGIRV